MVEPMTDNQIRLIYEYMDWIGVNGGSGGYDAHAMKAHLENPHSANRNLDSNDAWECVQEMEKKEDWGEFIDDVYRDFYRWIDRIRRGIKGQQVTEIDSPIETQFPKYIINPTNFFNCMAKWLEGREK